MSNIIYSLNVVWGHGKSVIKKGYHKKKEKKWMARQSGRKSEWTEYALWENGQLWSKTKAEALRKLQFSTGKRQSQQNNSFLKVPSSSSEYAYWLENLCSFNPVGQKVERRKVLPTWHLSLRWGYHLPHTVVTLWRAWKKKILPILCFLPAANSLFFTSVAVSTSWSPHPFSFCLLISLNIYSHLRSYSYTYMNFTFTFTVSH